MVKKTLTAALVVTFLAAGQMAKGMKKAA